MLKKTGASCLAITRTVADIVLSIACQTSRGAMIIIALLGVALPIAVHAHHSPQVNRTALFKAPLSPHISERAAS